MNRQKAPLLTLSNWQTKYQYIHYSSPRVDPSTSLQLQHHGTGPRSFTCKDEHASNSCALHTPILGTPLHEAASQLGHCKECQFLALYTHTSIAYLAQIIQCSIFCNSYSDAILAPAPRFNAEVVHENQCHSIANLHHGQVKLVSNSKARQVAKPCKPVS